MKLRLSSLVVLSAGLSYLLAVNSTTFSFFAFTILIIGGVLVTGASNGFNQIIERDTDALMPRTKDRPMPNDRLSVIEALVWCTILGLGGIFLLWYFLNPLSGVLATLALLLYVIVYTPLKKISPWAVFVGAFPGAIPPMLGWVAATGEFGLVPGVLFFVQFVWQFPHFWSIGWLSHDAYKNAGFYLLPFKGGKVKNNALATLILSALMIPTGALPAIIGVTGNISMIAAFILGIWFTFKALKFYASCEDKDARKLMFATFLYLPLIQIIYVLDKI
ncbi:MAG: protoheme IX farnesyltransferase [Flavobacteriales bacterium]|nr:protoheme IX farnesyltransferase [Flavobacteriales bacterium]